MVNFCNGYEVSWKLGSSLRSQLALEQSQQVCNHSKCPVTAIINILVWTILIEARAYFSYAKCTIILLDDPRLRISRLMRSRLCLSQYVFQVSSLNHSKVVRQIRTCIYTQHMLLESVLEETVHLNLR